MTISLRGERINYQIMYNLNSIDGEQHLILNLPKDLNFKDLFPTFTTKQLFATQFIVNQINHFSFYKKRQGYSFNVATHAKFLGITRNMVYTIIKVLTQNNIVEMVQNYKVGERNRCFKTVNPYSDENSIQVFFNRSEPKNYKFVNEFIDNGYRITPNDENIIQQKEIIVEEKSRIQDLEQEIKELKEALNKALKQIENKGEVSVGSVSENIVKPLKNNIKDTCVKLDEAFDDIDFEETIEDKAIEFEDEYTSDIYSILNENSIKKIRNITEGDRIYIDDKYIVYLNNGKLKIA